MDIQSPLPNTASQYLAAVDLGSNSFHLLVCLWQNGELTEVARQKEMVQLARGMDDDGNLATDALERAQSCFVLFRETLSRYPTAILTSVGTQALRKCNNSEDFLKMAEPLLGGPIEIISGKREAELVYQGVQFRLPTEKKGANSLVVDIGGASTELIIGKATDIKHWHSFPLGCVDLANRFFGGNRDTRRIYKDAFQPAYEYSRELLAAHSAQFTSASWDLVLGASGTMRVILDLLPNEPTQAIITKAHLQQLIQLASDNGELSDQVPDSLRWDVLPAGLALLLAIFDTLNIERLDVSPGSIKEGMMLESLKFTSACS